MKFWKIDNIFSLYLVDRMSAKPMAKKSSAPAVEGSNGPVQVQGYGKSGLSIRIRSDRHNFGGSRSGSGVGMCKKKLGLGSGSESGSASKW
jgi:hypothetical protein